MSFDRQLGTAFRPLEIAVLHALWQRQAASSVRDLLPEFPGVVYTTLMTTMDRLFRRGVLTRRKLGRAFVYTVRLSEFEQASMIARRWFDALLPREDPKSAGPVLAEFVDAISARGPELLDDLEQLIIQRRSTLRTTLDGDG